MQYKDNILGSNLFKKLTELLDNPSVPYFYNESTAFLENDKNNIFDGSFSHLIYQHGQPLSNLSPFIESVIYTAFDNAEILVNKIIRIRLGLITPTSETIIHHPHVDFYEPHNSALLYINDSDGDTVFYKERYIENSGNVYQAAKKITFTPETSVSPKANRFVWFDGFQYHSSSTPTKHAKRVVININYN